MLNTNPYANFDLRPSWRPSFVRSLGVRPLPHVAFFGRYELNAFRDLPGREGTLVTHLISPELRLALNPRGQLIGSYQRDTANDATIYYGRFAWEFQPLSFLYVVYSDRSRANPPEGFPAGERQLIRKLNYTWQI
jgi:hypothetical protein